MGQLSKEELLSGKTLKTLVVDLPQLGGTLTLREPSSAAAMRVRSLQNRSKRGEDVEADLMAEMISSTVLDQNGNLLLSHAEALLVLDRISLETATAFILKFNELAAPLKGGDEGNSKPSQSAS